MSKTSKSQKGRESPGEPGRARTESPGETGFPAFSPRALRDRGGKAGNPVFSPRALYICYRSAPNSTDKLPHVEVWGIILVESRKNGQIFRGIIWWNYLVGSTEFFRPPACPPAATPPRVPPRALGSGHPAPHRGAPFAARSPCFVAAGQRTENG